MENEGIMGLPMEAPMSQQEPMSVSSADSYDAAQTALGMVDPAALEMMKASLRETIADVDFSPREIDQMIDVLEYLTRNPGDYDRVMQDLISRDMMDPGDFPDQYDPTFIGAALAVLNELKTGRVQGAMAPMEAGPGMAPMAMAQGGLADMAQYLASRGRNGDTMLAHITPDEARMLRAQGGSGTINPETGLPEYFKKLFKKVGQVVKKVLSSPVGKIIGTIALAAVLGPAGIGLQLGSTAAASAAINAGLASAGTTLLGGGNLKQALVAGALGYVGGGGTIGGFSPLQSLGSVLPGAAGSALNTGLTTGALGTGAGLLMGMKPSEALKMGATSGLIAGGIAGIQGAPFMGAPGAEAAPTAPGGQTTVSSGETPSMPLAEAVGIDALQQAATAPDAPYGDVGPIGPIPTAANMAAQASALPDPTPGGVMPMAQAGVPTVPDYAAPAYPPSAPPPSTFFGRMAQGAGDLYNQYLSPSRPGLPADAGLIRKYLPLAAAGTAVAAASGAMKSSPSNPDPLGFGNSEYLKESARRAQERKEYLERVAPDIYTPLPSVSRPITPSGMATDPSRIPVSPVPTVTPSGVTMSPQGVAQPYNVAGLYGVPLLYEVPRRAAGGEMTMSDFPRKNGPINGPGTGTSDSIPAMLSDGEFVFTAKAVRNAGQGSRRKGAARMYKLMKMLEGGPVKGK